MLKKITVGIIGGLLGTVIGFVIGLFIGPFVGGNFFEDFVFNGMRGYEAAGQLGAIIGIFLGAVGGILLALKIVRGRKRDSLDK